MTTPDGVELLSTRYSPRNLDRGPVVLVRSPYGRNDRVWSRLLPRPLAARGYQVVVQSVRGTFGSGGRFEPGRHERQDGVAAVDWVRSQPWCDGRVATAGGSYVALTQWALAPHLQHPLDAMSVSIGSSTMLGGWYPGGALAVAQALRWAVLLAEQEDFSLRKQVSATRRVLQALRHPDYRGADRSALGATSPVFQEVVKHVDDQEHWAGAVDHSAERGRVTAAVSMVTGWHDLFLRDQLDDFQALLDAGGTPRLTVGPWSHASPGLLPATVQDTLELLDDVWGGRARTRPPVRLFVQGVEQWRDFPAWPPTSEPVEVPLSHDLASSASSQGRTITYDQADPTPAIGGPGLVGPAGRQVQTSLEARSDVLVYTGDVVNSPLTVIGSASVTVSVTVTANTLLLARLCDVDEKGVSRNVTEGLVRLRFEESLTQPQTTVIVLDPTAHAFRPGHRLRVQITAGAHPRVVEPIEDLRGAGASMHDLTLQHVPHLTLPNVAEAGPDLLAYS